MFEAQQFRKCWRFLCKWTRTSINPYSLFQAMVQSFLVLEYFIRPKFYCEFESEDELLYVVLAVDAHISLSVTQGVFE